jgi:hypothetical protein
LILSTPTSAESIDDKLDIGGQIRFRAEGDAKDFDADTDPHSFHLMRTRLNLDFHAASDARVFIQAQDSRTIGSPASGDLRNDSNLGIQQAYLFLDSWLFEGLYHQLGRFEYVKGNHRLLGNVGWHNVGRTWDGVMSGWRKDDLNIEAFLLKNEEGELLLNDDKDLIGVYISERVGDLFFLYERDNYRTSEARRQDRYTLGAYSSRVVNDLDYVANVAYQFGQTGFDESDISAYLLTVEFGYALLTDKSLRLAAGVDIASGDDDPADGEVKTFSNLYYTGHKLRGHMDYFLASAPYGLNDFMLRVSYSPESNWQLNGDLHLFRANVDFVSVIDGEDASSLGTETDLYAKHTRGRGTIQAGLSAFFPSEEWKGTEADPGFWGYFQLIVSF